jgi:hypothetical protein
MSVNEHSPPLFSDLETPMLQIFWGCLICVIDVRLASFDVINNFLGMILITLGLSTLRHFPMFDLDRSAMNTNYVLAFYETVISFFLDIVLSLYLSFYHPSFPLKFKFPPTCLLGVFVTILVGLFYVFLAWRTYLFCRCMENICYGQDKKELSRRWFFSQKLLVYSSWSIIFCICFALLLDWIKKLDHPVVGLLFGTFVVATAVFMMITIIYFLASLYRTANAAGNSY